MVCCNFFAFRFSKLLMPHQMYISSSYSKTAPYGHTLFLNDTNTILTEMHFMFLFATTSFICQHCRIFKAFFSRFKGGGQRAGAGHP